MGEHGNSHFHLEVQPISSTTKYMNSDADEANISSAASNAPVGLGPQKGDGIWQSVQMVTGEPDFI